MKILIYDNQLAYYELIKTSFTEGYEFILLNSKKNEFTEIEHDMLMFFLYDEIELLEFIKLYNEDTPVVLGLQNMEKLDEMKIEGNIYFLHLDKLKAEIIEETNSLLKKIKK